MTYNEQIAAIVNHIGSVLKPQFDVNQYAVGLLDENDDDDGHFEVRGSHTINGNPYAFSI